jgi:tripartite-type tricarboxylate transporter receptor subunit TctC
MVTIKGDGKPGRFAAPSTRLPSPAPRHSYLVTRIPSPVNLGALIASLAMTPLAPQAIAQGYPAKPIRLIVPVPPSGSSDILARMIGARLTESWGQPVVVENRPGANGNIGAELVARAAPDGYTVMMTDVGNLSISPSLYKLPFDVIGDFAPVTIVSYSPHMLLTHPSVPVKTVKELIALARAQPGRLNYATPLGSAPHLAGLMLAHRAGVRWEYIPVKGNSEAMLLVATGQSDLFMGGLLAMLQHAKSGRLKALAVSSERRAPSAPELPTIAEAANLPGFVTGTRQGMLAPARVPAAIVTRLNAEVVRIIRLPDVSKALTASGAELVGNSPAEMGSLIQSEKERWAKLIRETGFRLPQ